jgi:WD40 repeat protein
LLIGNSETLELWELESEKTIKRFNVQGLEISSISFSLDQKYVAAGSYGGSIRMWNVEREEEIWTNNPHQRSIKSVIASPKGNFIAIGSGEYNLDKKNGVIDLIEISTGKLNKRININGKIPVSIAFSPDERYIANIVEGEEVVEIRDIKTGNLFRRITSSRPLSICFSHNGKILAQGSEDHTIKLWDVSSGKLSKKLSGHTAGITSLSFSSDGRYLASGSDDNYFKLWQVNTGKILWSVFSPGFFDNIVAFSPDDKYVALASKPSGIIGEENLIILVESSTGKIIRSFNEHYYGVNSISFSSDGSLIASGNDDKTIKISDVSTGEIIKILEGHQLPVISVNFLPIPNRKYLVSSSEDGTVRLWNVETGKEIAMFVSFTDGEWVTITPEGYYDASANGDKYLNVRIGNRVYGIESYRETFFRPDLVKLALSGQELKDFKTLADIKLPPQVEILNAPSSAQQEEIDITVKLTDQGGGIGDVRLYLNETAVLVDGARGMKKISQDKTQTRSYRIKLVGGANVIKAVAFNADNSMQSNAAMHTVVANLKLKKPSMYVLAIGINEFKNPKLELRYAVADAKLFVEALKESAKELFEKIEVRLLTTKEETTKESIKAALEGMRGISPEDVFVFYVASHGIAEEGEYFLLTSNVGSVSTNRLREDALTQAELKEMIANVGSTKKFIALDACNSGKLGEELQVAMLARTRGMSEETAIKILSRAVGSMILSASTTQQEALEGYEGHGLFTFVLAEGLRGKADKDRDGVIRTVELSDYVDLKVPEIAERVFKRAQYPTATPSGQAFPIGKAK